MKYLYMILISSLFLTGCGEITEAEELFDLPVVIKTQEDNIKYLSALNLRLKSYRADVELLRVFAAMRKFLLRHQNNAPKLRLLRDSIVTTLSKCRKDCHVWIIELYSDIYSYLIEYIRFYESRKKKV